MSSIASASGGDNVGGGNSSKQRQHKAARESPGGRQYSATGTQQGLGGDQSLEDAEADVHGKPDEEVIDVLFDSDGNPRSGLDLSPLIVCSQTRLARLSSLLRMLGASTAFVTDQGLCTSYATRVTLFHVESHLIDEEEEEEEKRRTKSYERPLPPVPHPV